MTKVPTLGSYLKKYWGQYLGGLLCLLGVDFLELYIPQLTGAITDGLTAGEFPLRALLTDVLLIVAIAAVVSLMRFGWRVLMFGASRRVERDLREDLYGKLGGLSNRFFQHHKTGDLMAYFSNDMDAIRMAVGPGILTTFDAVVMTVMVLIKMIVYVDLKLTLLAMLPLLVGICYEILKWAGRSNSLLARAVSVPGLWLQHLTTFEPEDDMIEVANDFEQLKELLK